MWVKKLNLKSVKVQSNLIKCGIKVHSHTTQYTRSAGWYFKILIIVEVRQISELQHYSAVNNKEDLVLKKKIQI